MVTFQNGEFSIGFGLCPRYHQEICPLEEKGDFDKAHFGVLTGAK